MAILLPAAIAAAIVPPPPHPFTNFNLKYPNPCLAFLSRRFNPNARSLRLHSALSPQQPDPPPEKDPFRPKGITVTLSKLQDRVQIFFAVLFWMSLFFWASASDRKNNGSGRRTKGSPFKK